MAPPAAGLRRTPLYETHLRLGARMVAFGGWEMPVQYSGVIEEHHAVRRAVGLFDVSHMGEIEVFGPEALELVNHATTNDASRLAVGQAQYSALLYRHGGFVDDILVHKVAEDRYFLCVNAANQDKDHAHLLANNRFNAAVENAGARYAQIAVQGPRAANTLQKLTPMALAGIRYYHFADGQAAGAWARIARTGYTGEDGFEIYTRPEDAARLWDGLLAAGAEFGIKPCGLGARNTLRLEAGLALYDHEIHASIVPWEARLDWIVKLDKGDFVGRAALLKRRENVTRRLMGFEMTGRGVARDGYEVYLNGAGAGWVTSGGPSPTLGKNIGMCYLPAAYARPGQNIEVIVRGQPVPAVTVATPFYRRLK
jgi:aminomethyltransferase